MSKNKVRVSARYHVVPTKHASERLCNGLIRVYPIESGWSFHIHLYQDGVWMAGNLPKMEQRNAFIERQYERWIRKEYKRITKKKLTTTGGEP